LSGTRLVPVSEGRPFPYQAVRAALLELPAIECTALELGRMIEVGKRLGWSREQLDAHEELRRGGRCFNFRQNEPPWLRGTCWEDNVFFEYDDEKQEAAVRPVIVELAGRLGLKVLEY
jgi:hypothetical protein